MKALKILALALASVVVLLIAGALVIAWTFDPNDYKDHLTGWVEERTGRELRVEEDLELSFFPWLAVETGGVSLGNAPGFEALPFATVQRAAVRVKLMPLLGRQLEIGTVLLDGVELNLARDAEGRGNWEDLLVREADADEAPERASDAGDWLDDLQVEGFRIRNATVTWSENTTELRYAVSDARLETGPIALGRPVDVELGLQALDAVAQTTVGLGGRVSLLYDSSGAAEARNLSLQYAYADGQSPQRAEGRLEAARIAADAAGALELGATTLTARLSGIPGAPENLDVAARLDAAAFDPGTGNLTLQGLQTETGGVSAAWRLAGRNLTSAPELEGAVEVGPAPLARVLDLMGVERPQGLAPEALGELRLTTDFSAALEPRRVRLPNLDARLLGMQLGANLELEDERVRGRLEIPEFSPNGAWLALTEDRLPAELDLRAAGNLSLAARFEADAAGEHVTLSEVRAGLFGATLQASLEMASAANGTRYTGSLTVPPFEPHALARALADALPEPLTAEQLGRLALGTRFAYDNGADTLALEELRIQAAGLDASGRIAGRSVSGDAAWSGEIRLAPFSPRDLLRRFDEPVPETSDPTVLARAALAGRFEVAGERARFEDVTFTLDDTTITGSFTAEGFSSPAYTFALAVDRLNADRYLPPQAQDAEPGEAVAGEMELPVDVLNALNLRGRAEVGQLTLAGLDFAQISADLAWGDGAASLDSARAQLYGGEFLGSFGIDGRGSVPGLRLNGRASDIALAPIIEAFTGDANLSGTGSFDLDLSGRGATFIDSVRSASGTASFALRNGALEGFNLARSLCQAYNLLRREAAPPSQPRRTSFDVIQGTADIREGVAHSRDLLARSDFMEVTGSGSLVLEEQLMDYDLEATLSGPIEIPNCETMEGLIGESIPLRVNGPVTDPDIAPDYSEILERSIRRQLERRATDRLQDLIRRR